jgi:putative Mn2+ efflux pump MntP
MKKLLFPLMFLLFPVLCYGHNPGGPVTTAKNALWAPLLSLIIPAIYICCFLARGAESKKELFKQALLIWFLGIAFVIIAFIPMAIYTFFNYAADDYYFYVVSCLVLLGNGLGLVICLLHNKDTKEKDNTQQTKLPE